MSFHKTTKKRGVVNATISTDPESLMRFAELLKLRSLAFTTQSEYLRYVRKLASRTKRDPATLTEEEVRAHLLHLKTRQRYSPSSMRSAVAALTAFYNLHLGYEWKLFGLVRSPSAQTLPAVLTREQVRALFAAVREERFRVFLRLVYACGLRLSEAQALEVGDIREGAYLQMKKTKGMKERRVPLPRWTYLELRAFWKTHRHPRLIFPGTGRGWRDRPESQRTLAQAREPMSAGSVQTCLRHARAAARLPEGTCVHTLRHSYATHLLEEGVHIRLISAYLGHSSLETTMIYLHLTAVNEGQARDALDRLEPK